MKRWHRIWDERWYLECKSKSCKLFHVVDFDTKKKWHSFKKVEYEQVG